MMVDVHLVERSYAVWSRLVTMATAHRRAGILMALGLVLATPSRAHAFECTAVPDSNLTQAWNQRCVPYWIRSGDGLFSGSEIEALVMSSFARWSSEVAGTDFELVFAGYTSQGAGFDNREPNEQQNVVLSASGAEAAELFENNPRLLALTFTSFSTETGEIFDADIAFNREAANFAVVEEACLPQATDAPFDIENTLVHEVGHFVGFDHVTDPEATMFETAARCETEKRTLEADDIAAITTVYPPGGPTSTCRPPASYEGSNGDPSVFRDQCNRPNDDCGCAATRPLTPKSPGLIWLGVLMALLLRRRR